MTLPFLDRLFVPKVPSGGGALIESIRREIEWLLESDSRQTEMTLPPRVARSVWNFGVKKWSSLIGATKNMQDPTVRAEVEDAVAEAIAAFEPRLQDIEVRVRPDKTNAGADVRMEIRAVLRPQLGGESVAFETVIQEGGSPGRKGPAVLSVRRAVALAR